MQGPDDTPRHTSGAEDWRAAYLVRRRRAGKVRLALGETPPERR